MKRMKIQPIGLFAFIIGLISLYPIALYYTLVAVKYCCIENIEESLWINQFIAFRIFFSAPLMLICGIILLIYEENLKKIIGYTFILIAIFWLFTLLTSDF